jgi:hypothetical protein
VKSRKRPVSRKSEKQKAARIQEDLEGWVAHEIARTAPPSLTRVEISSKWDELFWSHVRFMLFVGLSCGSTIIAIVSLSRLTSELGRHAHSTDPTKEMPDKECVSEDPT